MSLNPRLATNYFASSSICLSFTRNKKRGKLAMIAPPDKQVYQFDASPSAVLIEDRLDKDEVEA